MTEDFHKQPTQPGLSPSDKLFFHEKIPQKIGIFKIEGLLEKGGMSTVYLGTHPETNDPVTIKVLQTKFLSQPEVVSRFINEAEIISMSDHPNIVKMYSHGEWENGFFIAMEFIQGVSLRQFIQQAPISLKKSLEIILDICYALCHLHTHGVIHRDLKPENILITDDGVIKVIDFGIAQLLHEKGDEKSEQRQRFMGTPFYMSPEQKLNPENVTVATDIYSLGIISYELITGKLSHGHIHLALLPKGLQTIFSKALQPKVQDRYQDIVDLISDLSNYINSEALEKEKKAGGQVQFGEIVEQVKQVQWALSPKNPPSWKGVEVGISAFKGISLTSSPYYDFFELPNNGFIFLMAEAAAQGVAGLTQSASLRGMIRSLAKLSDRSSDLMALLNKMIVEEGQNQVFALHYLTLNQKENSLSYLSCGYGNLWHIPAGVEQPKKIQNDNIALGIDASKGQFSETKASWNVGDILLLNNFPTTATKDHHQGIDEGLVRDALRENLHMPAQKQAELILRKIRANAPSLWDDRPMIVMSIHRTD